MDKDSCNDIRRAKLQRQATRCALWNEKHLHLCSCVDLTKLKPSSYVGEDVNNDAPHKSRLNAIVPTAFQVDATSQRKHWTISIDIFRV